jgi:hypothetical protein
MAQSRTAVNAKAGAPDSMDSLDPSIVPGQQSKGDDKGGPTNKDYKPDNDSAKIDTSGVPSQSKTVVNDKAAPASGGMESLGDNIIPGSGSYDGTSPGRSNEGPDTSIQPSLVPGQSKPTSTKEHAEVDATAGEAMDELASDHEASDDFKLKAKVIFEGALNEKLKIEVQRLEEEFSARFEQEITDIAEKVESFLNYTSQQWLEENKLVVENGIKNELSESFMQGMRTLFEDHYVTLPDEKYDIFESMVAKLDDMEDKLNEQIETNVSLASQMSGYQRQSILADVSWDLSETAKEKLAGLAEGVEFESEDVYTQKLNILKESFVGAPEQNEEILQEASEPVEQALQETYGTSMASYVNALGRSLRN